MAGEVKKALSSKLLQMNFMKRGTKLQEHDNKQQDTKEPNAMDVDSTKEAPLEAGVPNEDFGAKGPAVAVSAAEGPGQTVLILYHMAWYSINSVDFIL
jgi:hypothetical protein